MQLFDDKTRYEYNVFNKEYDRYTTFAQTQKDYNGCYSQDDDAADHIRIPRLSSVYTL